MTIQGTPGTQHNDWGSMRDHQVQPQPEHDEAEAQAADDTDGLTGKKPEELTPEELRLMADTMPGDGPGD